MLLPPFNLPEDVILLITDELSAPADFLLHRTLSIHLKRPVRRGEDSWEDQEQNQNEPQALILSVSEDYGRWKALASKASINLQHHVDLGQVVFIDLLANGNPMGKSSLREVFNLIQDHLSKNPAHTLLIVDDISTLHWIGFSDVENFIRALRALCLKNKHTLIIRHHLISPSTTDHDDLFQFLLQICSHHLEVRPLSSGRSGTVTGEILLHRGFSNLSDTVKLIDKGSALQYRLTDAGPEFFAKGMSAGIL